MQKVKLGIIGIGNMGTTHAKNVLEGKVPTLELAAVADRQSSRRNWCRENMPQSVQIFEEGSELIQSGGCDAVLIAVPHYQHPSLAMDAFDKGLHVLCENLQACIPDRCGK